MVVVVVLMLVVVIVVLGLAVVGCGGLLVALGWLVGGGLTGGGSDVGGTCGSRVYCRRRVGLPGTGWDCWVHCTSHIEVATENEKFLPYPLQEKYVLHKTKLLRY